MIKKGFPPLPAQEEIMVLRSKACVCLVSKKKMKSK